MKRSLIILSFLLGILSAAVPAFAHHSFSSEFDINQPVKLVGVLTKLDWVNPHGFIYLDVKGSDGKVVNWAVETGGPNALLRRGVRKTDFVIGTKITVQGFKAKSGQMDRALALCIGYFLLRLLEFLLQFFKGIEHLIGLRF